MIPSTLNDKFAQTNKHVVVDDFVLDPFGLCEMGLKDSAKKSN